MAVGFFWQNILSPERQQNNIRDVTHRIHARQEDTPKVIQHNKESKGRKRHFRLIRVLVYIDRVLDDLVEKKVKRT